MNADREEAAMQERPRTGHDAPLPSPRKHPANGLSGGSDGGERRFGSLGGWLVAGVLTFAYLHMATGWMCHGPPPVHPRVGMLGACLVGLSPLITYAAFLLLRRRPARSFVIKLGRSGLLVSLFLLCQYAGISLVKHAREGQDYPPRLAPPEQGAPPEGSPPSPDAPSPQNAVSVGDTGDAGATGDDGGADQPAE